MLIIPIRRFALLITALSTAIACSQQTSESTVAAKIYEELMRSKTTESAEES